MMQSYGETPQASTTTVRRRRGEDDPDDDEHEDTTTWQGNDKYRGMTEDDCKQHMKWVVYLWSATQLFGSFAMPAWIAVFATQWYTAVNLVPGEVALVITFSKCIDVLTDPMMACYLRSCTMHTIANISILGAVIQSIAFVMIFVPFKPSNPRGGHDAVLIQYAISYVLFFIGDTLTGTPTTTLGTMLKSQRILDEPHHNDGLRIGSMMKVIGILIMGFVTVIVGYIIDGTGNEMGQEDGVQSGLMPVTNLVCAILFGVMHVIINISFTGVVKGYHDSTVSPALKAALKKTSFLQQFSEMMTSSYNNPYFRQLIGAWVCDQLTVTLMKNLLMWFVRHKVEPELAKGCPAYNDTANAQYIEDEGFESGFPKSDFECKASNVAVVGVFFVIVGAVVGNVFWQKKLESEKDRYGNRNVYKNWLLFNLSSAVTNGLMVFVGRGDNRLFWMLCFINGLPIGGEYMTDTILLFLIASETWLSRSDMPLTSLQEAEQLDSHTTKFSMMKTFIPKAVSLIAEAMPLALIQIWYKEPRELCYEADPPITDLNSLECADFLSYNESQGGGPKYIPQKPQVSELISFFFFILPTLTCLVSYYIKSQFQVTDSGELVMLDTLRKGTPDPDGETSRMNPLKRLEAEELDQRTRQRLQGTLTEFASRLSHSVQRDVVDALVFQLQEAAADGRGHGTGKQITKVQSLASIVLPKYLKDEWLGTLIPTTYSQHLFRLPYVTHPLTRVPVTILEFATEEQPTSTIPPWIRHTIYDARNVSAIKGLLHGIFAVVMIPVMLLMSGVSMGCTGLVYFMQRCIPGFREKTGPRPGQPTMFFGVLGRRSIGTFTDKILPAVAAHVLSPNCVESADENTQAVTDMLFQERVQNPDAHIREERLKGTSDEIIFTGGNVYAEDRIISRLVYLKTVGYAVMFTMVLLISVILANEGIDIIKGKWSIVITVPLFVAAVGLVFGLYFHGLHTLSYKDEDGNRVLCAERRLDGEGVVALAVTHYNTYNYPGGNPLIFNDRGESKGKLLHGLKTPPMVLTTATPGRPPDSNSMAFVTFVPTHATSTCAKHLSSIHRVLDTVQADANRAHPETRIRWGVSNISPASFYPQYKCLLYYWESLPPPVLAPKSSGIDRKKAN